ncbi:MAG TPA: AsmA-like C-terminal domain-containing protein [Spirochaetota bacterium]|nr:AsmA-like C-terminal domain-containing protein [Spirochaetota bacterium]HPV42600.1 AsmA-like C-terminal domain-containing protein [Spirochaetota bacterium]
MTQHVKKVFIYILCVAIAALYLAVRAVDDINFSLNYKPIKNILVRYLEGKIKTSVGVGELHIALFQEPGITFSRVLIGTPGGHPVSANEVTLFFSFIQRINEGDWLKRIRIDRLRLDITAQSLKDETAIPRFSLPEIELRHPDVTIRVREKVISFGGPMTGYARVRSNGSISIIGELRFDNTQLRYNDDIIKLNGTVIMKGHDIYSPGLDFISEPLVVSASGTYTGGGHRTFHGRVHIKNLAIGGGRGGGSPILDVILDRLNGGADFSISDMTLYGIPVDTVACEGVAKDGSLILNDLQARGAFMNGEGSVIMTPGQNTAFNVAFTLKGFDIRRVLDTVFPGKQSWIDGAMNLEGRVWGNSGSIFGDLIFSSFNGRLMKFEALSKMFGAFNFYKMALNRNPDMKTKGFPYNSILSRITIKESMVSFDSFYLDSNSIQLSANGTYSMKNDRLDALLGIRPLETLDRAVGLIPVIGWLLVGANEGMFVIYCRMTGSFDELRVVPAPMITIARGIGDTLLRTLTLPYTIFTRPQKLIPGLAGRPDEKLKNGKGAARPSVRRRTTR